MKYSGEGGGHTNQGEEFLMKDFHNNLTTIDNLGNQDTYSVWHIIFKPFQGLNYTLYSAHAPHIYTHILIPIQTQAFYNLFFFLEPYFLEPYFLEPYFLEPYFLEPYFIKPYFPNPHFLEPHSLEMTLSYNHNLNYHTL